jgi:crotonobetainyl-CoA:carnitine CoA-transferase CaiB-like acyl-CoA transferase
LAAFRSERYLMIDGQAPPSPWGPLSGYFRTADDRYVQLHANFPHHHAGLVELLQCADDRDAVKAAIRDWRGEDFETAAGARGLCVGLLRSRAEWEAHPQGQAVAGLPLLEIDKIGDSPPEPLPPGTRPLSDVRVLDLTRVIAGPVCGRTLAAHGADVLRVGAPHLPLLPHVWLELARGKRSCHLDLREHTDRVMLEALVKDSDIFSQAYRPDALAQFGFGPDELASLRPGIVFVTLCAYGHQGPWADRRGFDSLVQTVSGIGDAGAKAAGIRGTKPLPCQALDHATGYLAAFGAMVALMRRAEEGGSYQVRVSLAQTGNWLFNLGLIDGLDEPDVGIDDVRDRLEERTSPHGTIMAVRSAENLDETPARWDRTATPLGADQPQWIGAAMRSRRP